MSKKDNLIKISQVEDFDNTQSIFQSNQYYKESMKCPPDWNRGIVEKQMNTLYLYNNNDEKCIAKFNWEEG